MITKTEKLALERIWVRMLKPGWKSFDEFVSWSIQNKWRTGKALYKLDERKAHGPDNSYWYLKHNEVPASENPICLACERNYCPGNDIGCKQWRDSWIKNWNENICIHIPEKKEQQKREVFQYEHPDLVREGIVFEPN